MIWIVLGVLLILAAGVVGFFMGSGDDVFMGAALAFCGAFIASFVIGPLAWWLIGATSGLMPDYSEGVRYGYMTKMSRRGLIWKTHEGQMQIGTGEMAALQAPFSFCVPDEKVRAKVMSLIGTGQKAGIRYRQWLVVPFRLGSSSYEITGVEDD